MTGKQQHHEDREEDQQVGSIVKIDKSTLIPIGLGITVVLCAVSVATWLQGSILAMRHDYEKSNMVIANELGKTQNKIDELSVKITGLSSSAWTFEDMKALMRLLKAENPTLSVPEVVRSH